MANNLKSFKFTKKADTAISVKGWEVLREGVVIDALAGNDTITGTGKGIFNSGTINTGTGNDTIIGTGGYSGIYNNGTINTGDGKDTITGTGTGDFYGIGNDGTINTGAGNDRITGTGGTGIYNDDGTINTGDGNDIIKGTSSTGSGISNYGTINTGDGNDRITGTGGTGSGIYNDDDGTINTGDGNDIVDALEGGFDGEGTTYLDAGNDTLKGFGTGNFYGGAGTDKLFFGEGTYVISGSTVVFNGATMNVNQFEKIGGANGGLFTFQDGTLTVSSTGVGTFA